jgi:hypothetical protein
MAKRKKGGRASGLLFIEGGQLRLAEKSVEQELLEQQQVECLGRTFPNDEARRAYFFGKLREKLKDPEFRKTEGFPIGKDEDILAISDPPYYTACPNPFLAEFVKHYGKPYDPNMPYHRAPFAVDVSEGKTDPLYTAHSYHTKVPHKAIMRAILHYTERGDLVLDGFAGSGMTGVAAQLCGNPEKEFKQAVDAEWKAAGLKPPVWGARRAVLSELAPAATFIAANYNLPFDVREFAKAAQTILDELEAELGWMYETLHKDGKTKGRINYTVWSEVFACPHCSGEVVFLEQALDKTTMGIKKEFRCAHCKAMLSRRQLERLYESRRDSVFNRTVKMPKRKPVLIVYSVGETKFTKKPDSEDMELLSRVARLDLPPEVPTAPLPYMHMTHERARMDQCGITHLHHFFLPRPAHVLAAMWRKAKSACHPRIRHMLLFLVEQAIWTCSLLNRYRPTGYSQVNQYMTGIYYVPSQHAECSPWYVLDGKLQRLAAAFGAYKPSEANGCTATTSSTASLGLPDNCIDYVFTDPPFGENIYYADLNFLVESWHRVRTNAKPEAIVDRAKGKHLSDYQALMRRCLAEFYRVLKPGRWMTMVFHNSSNAVWNAIQEALLSGGFVVADVRTLDKQQGSYRQVTSTAVKQDLVISAYKPNEGLERQFKLHAGSAEKVWDFVRHHLRQLPVFVETKGKAERIAERQAHLLFDRMLAFHVERGASIPLSAAEFYAGLKERFPERDGMYFLPDQVPIYDRRRLKVEEVLQLELFVNDEKSALLWLRQQLEREPQTFQQIQPRFLRELHKANHEYLPELRKLLEQNFLEDDSGRWYVPDPNRQLDLEKLREKDLLREFDAYKLSKERKLKVFRAEAVRAGFKAAWADRDYHTIIKVAEKLPESVIQEDQSLLMYYDNALMRAGG